MGTGGVLLRRLRAKVMDEPTNFGWVEKRRLAASGLPSSKAQLAWLTKNGINSILTLTESPLPREWLPNGVKYEHVPMDDEEPPTMSALHEAVSHVEDELAEGRTLLVHCLAGIGRTGSVLAAYRVKKYGLSAADAIDWIRNKRPCSVEQSQESAIYEFEKLNTRK